MHVYSVIVFFVLVEPRYFVCNKEARSAPTSTLLLHSTPSGAAIMLTMTNGSEERTHTPQCYAELEWRRSSVTWHLATKQLAASVNYRIPDVPLNGVSAACAVFGRLRVQCVLR